LELSPEEIKYFISIFVNESEEFIKENVQAEKDRATPVGNVQESLFKKSNLIY